MRGDRVWQSRLIEPQALSRPSDTLSRRERVSRNCSAAASSGLGAHQRQRTGDAALRLCVEVGEAIRKEPIPNMLDLSTALAVRAIRVTDRLRPWHEHRYKKGAK